MKAEVYQIFNEIQTRTNTVENFESFVSIFEKEKSAVKFNEVIENVFLIIFNNYEKNNVVLKNIKEFMKDFLEKIVKVAKLKEKTKTFINYFCNLFTQTVKKPKYKGLCIYFLNVFLVPYSSDYSVLYSSETLEEIKNFILNILRSKQTSHHSAVLKLLQKHTTLQKENDVWERLESLLNNSTQIIKKEILKILEIENPNILNYLLEMYDDEAIEIRHFVYEKLSEIKNFEMINSTTKVKLFYVGLSDVSPKVQQAAKKFLKNYLYSIGIYKSKKVDDGKMLIDEEDFLNIDANKGSAKKKKQKDVESEDEDEDDEKEKKIKTTIEKITNVTSPMKTHKKKLMDSPSRVFDRLDFKSFYNHPKYSYSFQLITDAIIEFTDSENLIEFLKNIIDNMVSVSSSVNDSRHQTSEKKKRNNHNNSLHDISMSSISLDGGKIDVEALFNDIYFLQNCIKHISSKRDEASASLKTTIFDLLPDNKTFARIVNHFYAKDKKIMILHQLFLIGFHLSYEDEIGNREMITVLKKFICDLTLENETIMSDSSQKKLDFNNNMQSQPDNINELNNQEIDDEKMLIKNMENILLPNNRRIILSMDDMLEYALKILLKIHYNQNILLFTSIMESVNEINEPLEVDKEKNNLSALKGRQKELIERIKEKMASIGALDDKKKKDGKNKFEIDKKLIKEQSELTQLDDELYQVTQEERNILIRKLKLCEFLIKYCRVPVNVFDPMVNTIILPTLQRKEFPEVMKHSYNAMGLLAINFFGSNYKNFLKLFYEQIEKNNPEFQEFEMISLFIIFDSILHNNMSEANILNGSIDEKIEIIIKKYLYHHDNVARTVAFTGLCKLLIANRIGRPEFVLARLISVLYKTFDITDRSNDDFHIKIFEIMQNFLYAYCFHKSHIKSLVKAVLIIITAHMVGDNAMTYDRSVCSDFMETKLEFLNQFLLLAHEHSVGKSSMKKIIFKIFKYLYFIYTYTSGDIDKAIENNDEVKENNKKFNLKYKNKSNVKNNIKKFFERSKYDQFLVNDMSDENSYLKFLPFILNLEDYHVLKVFSEPLSKHYDALKEKNFIVGSEDRSMNLSSEERQNELKEYVMNKEMQYYKQIEDYYFFINTLKNDKLDVIQEETSKLDDESMIHHSTGKNKNNITMKGDKRKSKPSDEKNKSKVNNSKMIQLEDEDEDESKNEEPVEEEVNTTKTNNRKKSKSPKKTLKRKHSVSPTNKNNKKTKGKKNK